MKCIYTVLVYLRANKTFFAGVHKVVSRSDQSIFLNLCLTSELCPTSTVTAIRQETAGLRERVVTLSVTPRHVETQFIASQSCPMSASSLISSPCSSPVLCWCGKCQHQNIEPQTDPEYPLFNWAARCLDYKTRHGPQSIY